MNRKIFEWCNNHKKWWFAVLVVKNLSKNRYNATKKQRKPPISLNFKKKLGFLEQIKKQEYLCYAITQIWK